MNKRVSETASEVQQYSNKKHKLDTYHYHENAVCFVAQDFRDEFSKAQEKSKKVQVYIDAVAKAQAQV
jgi:hypothetical protein